MLWKYNVAREVKEFELHHNPVIITVNKFDEDSAKEFRTKIAMAHNTGQKIIPVVIEIIRELKKDSKNFSLIKDK